MSNDKKIIKKLESMLGISLDEISAMGSTGYKLEDDNVIGLSLPGRKFTEVPELIRELSNLKSLNISNNELSKLPEWLKELEWLLLDRNKFTTIPESLRDYKNLKYLNISENPITFLPEWLPELNSLEELHLEESYDLEWNQKNIDIYKAVRNKNVKIYMPNLFRLHVIKGVPKEQVEIIIDLIKINSVSKYTEILIAEKFDYQFKRQRNAVIDIRVKDGQIAKLGILEYKIKTIPDNFSELKSLTYLNLTKNKLESLPDSFGELTNLEELDLSGNPLTSLPDSFSNLSTISKLNLSNCQFSDIPTQLWALKELTELDLSGNPLSSEENTIIQKVPDLIREYLRVKATIVVFISHAVIDFEPYRIGELQQYLENQKEISQVFYCEQDLAGNIDEWMLNAVQKSQLILFIGTNKSVFNSVDCANELQLADKFSIPVIPLKGKDVDWPDLAERGLSRELGLEYDVDNFDEFCSDVYKYIENFKREINLMEKEGRQKGIIDIYERFRLILDENLSELVRKLDGLADNVKNISDRIDALEKRS